MTVCAAPDVRDEGGTDGALPPPVRMMSTIWRRPARLAAGPRLHRGVRRQGTPKSSPCSAMTVRTLAAGMAAGT